MAMVWLESAPSRLVTTVEVVGELASPPSKTTTPARGFAASGSKTITRWPAVMRSPGLQDQPGLERNIVDEGAVLAAEVLHGPVIALGFESEVLA